MILSILKVISGLEAEVFIISKIHSMNSIKLVPLTQVKEELASMKEGIVLVTRKPSVGTNANFQELYNKLGDFVYDESDPDYVDHIKTGFVDIAPGRPVVVLFAAVSKVVEPLDIESSRERILIMTFEDIPKSEFRFLDNVMRHCTDKGVRLIICADSIEGPEDAAGSDDSETTTKTKSDEQKD